MFFKKTIDRYIDNRVNKETKEMRSKVFELECLVRLLIKSENDRTRENEKKRK